MSGALAVRKSPPAPAREPEDTFDSFFARNVRRAPRLLAVVLAFFFIRALGARAGAVLLIAASAAIWPVAVFRPEIGLYALILNFVNEWDSYYRLQQYVPVSLPILFDAAVGIGILLQLGARRGQRLGLESVQIVLLALYVILVTLGVLVSDVRVPNLWASFRTGFLIRPVTFLFAALLIRDPRSLHRILLALLIAHTLLMTTAMSDFLQKGGETLYRVRGTVTAVNYLSYVCVVTLSLLIGLFVYLRERLAKYAMLLLAIVTLFICMRTLSRSGYYALGATLLFLAFRLIRRPQTMIVAVGFGLLFFLMTPAALTQRLGEVESLTTTDRYFLSRVALRMAMDNPALGVGWHAYERRFLDYDREHVFHKPKQPHSLYLAIAAGSGIPALLVYLMLFGVTIVQLFRVERDYLRARAPNAFGRYLAVSLQAALVGHFVFGLAGSYGDSYYAFLLLAFAFVLVRH
ncbi:MAG: O-antigen ligase family protein, partial [Candidatus Binatia bacterium]